MYCKMISLLQLDDQLFAATCLCVSTQVGTQSVLKYGNREIEEREIKWESEEGGSGWLPWYLSLAMLQKY